MLSNKEQLEWLLAMELVKEQTDNKSQTGMICRMMDVFKKHDITLSTTVDILQEIDAINKEYQVRSKDICSLNDILNLRSKKNK